MRRRRFAGLNAGFLVDAGRPYRHVPAGRPSMLILVVGPSGAGKDTLLDVARETLAHDRRFRFARRVITRPVTAGGEDHEATTEAEFRRRSFALQWQAHGLQYGIPQDIAADIEAGVHVVANVSRAVIQQASRRFPLRVIVITAPAAVLAERLHGRGRETAADIARRLARDVPIPPGIEVVTILNDASVAEGARRFTAALLEQPR